MGSRCEVNEEIIEIAGMIRSLFDRPLQANERAMSTTVSIGVAVDQRNQLCLSELLGQASAAATVVRDRGGNDIEEFADQMRDTVDRRLFIEVNLKQSLKLGHFINLYQPQIEILSGRIVGLEALLRWQHPEIGPVTPAEFIGRQARDEELLRQRTEPSGYGFRARRLSAATSSANGVGVSDGRGDRAAERQIPCSGVRGTARRIVRRGIRTGAAEHCRRPVAGRAGKPWFRTIGGACKSRSRSAQYAVSTIYRRALVD